MASPLLESFCCDPEIIIRNESDSSPMNATSNDTDDMVTGMIYNIFCVTSSILSIAGSVYQLIPRIPRILPRSVWELKMLLRQNSIICHLAVFDFAASLAVLVRSMVWLLGYFPHHKTSKSALEYRYSLLFCAISSILVQYLYICTFLWTLIYAIDTHLIMQDKKSRICFYRIFILGMSFLLIIPGSVMLYIPDFLHCVPHVWTILPIVLSSYLPVFVVIIVNPILYRKALKAVESRLYSGGIFTDNERKIISSVRSRFKSIIMAFSICWLPNILNFFFAPMYYLLPRDLFQVLFHLMALLNPLQGFLNSLVYNGSGLCTKRFLLRRGIISPSTNGVETYGGFEDSLETSTLLRSNERCRSH